MVALLAVAAGGTPVALAEWVDADRPATIAVGAPVGHAVAPRLGPHRLGRVDARLPARPREAWRHELPGPLDVPPVVDPAGEIWAATSNGKVVRLGPDGVERWRATLGPAAPAVAPVRTSAGSLAVVCSDGRVRRVGPSGAVRTGPPLYLHTRKAEACPVALEDDGLVVAGERQLAWLDGADRPIARAALPQRPLGGLIRRGHAVLATLEDGTVVEWRPPRAPRTLLELDGAPHGGGVLIGPSLLAVVIDRARVVTVDLRTGQARLLAGPGATGRQFDGPVVLDGQGRLVVATVVGELLVFDRRGAVAQQLALENETLIFGADGGAPLPTLFRKVELEPSPPLLVDRRGRVGFLRASGRLGVVDPSAAEPALRMASARFCAEPLALLPAGEGRMLAACENGSLGMFEDG